MITDDVIHKPVLLEQTLTALNIKPGGVYADCTCGFGGHSSRIAAQLGENGKLIAIDQDETALEYASSRMEPLGKHIVFVRDNFANIDGILAQLGIDSIDGALIDLGVSSFQLDTPERGFSYMADGPLDMRMNPSNPLTAREVVNELPRERLREIIWEYGEERFASSIASAIERERAKEPIETTLRLAEIIKYAIPPAARAGGHHPAKRSFQAIRIFVNNEIDIIAPAIRSLADRLAPGGRLAVITFHSLEDRAVKQTFVELSRGCICPNDYPVCMCGHQPTLKAVTRKPVTAEQSELDENPRSRSAKLRCAEKTNLTNKTKDM